MYKYCSSPTSAHRARSPTWRRDRTVPRRRRAATVRRRVAQVATVQYRSVQVARRHRRMRAVVAGTCLAARRAGAVAAREGWIRNGRAQHVVSGAVAIAIVRRALGAHFGADRRHLAYTVSARDTVSARTAGAGRSVSRRGSPRNQNSNLRKKRAQFVRRV